MRLRLMRHFHRGAFCVAFAVLTGCGSQRVCVGSHVCDAAGAAAFDLVVRVVRDDQPATIFSSVRPFSVVRPASGFLVRADNGRGDSVENETDAMGVAHLPVDMSAGPWDVTIAASDYIAVSIIGVTGPIDGAVYTCPIHADFRGHVRMFTPTVTPWTVAHATTASSPDITLYPYSNPSGPGFTLQGLFGDEQDGPTVRTFALEYIASDTSPVLVNAARGPDVTLGSADVAVNVPIPAAAVMPVRVRVPITLPAQGVLTTLGSSSAPPVSFGSVDKICDAVAGCGGEVGIVTASGLPGQQQSVMEVQFVPGDLAPIHASISFPGTGFGLQVSTRTFDGTDAIDVPEVHALPLGGPSLQIPATDEPNYDHLYVTETIVIPRMEAPDLATVWRVFTYRGAATAARTFPTLPGGMTFNQLIGTGDGRDTPSAYIVRDPAGPAPWSERYPGAQARVMVW